MISKELLSEVLEIEVIEVKDKTTGALYVPDNSIGFAWEEEISGLINIHELAYKCKEWAYNKKDTILTSWKDRDCCYCEVDNNIMCFSADDEAIAIFKACEWIMEQTK